MSVELPVNGKNGSMHPKWAPILGSWRIEEGIQIFLGEGHPAIAHGQSFPIGLVVSNANLQSGLCRTRIRFSRELGESEQAAGIVIGYRSPEHHYVFAELG